MVEAIFVLGTFVLEQDQEQDDDHGASPVLGVPCSAGRVRPSGSSLNGYEQKFAAAVLLACSLACLLAVREREKIFLQARRGWTALQSCEASTIQADFARARVYLENPHCVAWYAEILVAHSDRLRVRADGWSSWVAAARGRQAAAVESGRNDPFVAR